MTEEIKIMTREEAENFIEGNDNPEYGECWLNISDELDKSFKGVQTQNVISQRISDGKYFRGQYEWHRDEGWFPYRWGSEDEPYMVLTEVFLNYEVVRTFGNEVVEQNIITLSYDLIENVYRMIDEFAINKYGGYEYVSEAIDKLLDVIKNNNTKLK